MSSMLGTESSSGTPADPLELVIVGAGPHGLALLLRLLDDDPDESGDFFVGLGSKARAWRRTRADLGRQRCSKETAKAILKRVRVVDEGGSWLNRWDDQFQALEIPHLRSPSDQNPCPYDSFALQQFAAARGRECEFVNLEPGSVPDCECCGFKGNFLLPSTALFRDFCAHLLSQYPAVANHVTRGRVKTLERLDDDLARVVLADGTSMVARRVVVAVGPSAAPRLPDWAPGGTTHAWDVVAARARGEEIAAAGERVAVVGGGLTSAHLCFVAERLGCATTLVARRERLRVSQYDLDLAWLGWRTRPGRIAKYLSGRTPPEARLAMLSAARRGGSVSPEAHRLLLASASRVVVDADVVSADSVDGETWLETADARRFGPFDRVWLATGGAPGVAGSPLFADLLRARPVEVVGGYPRLHPSLRWELDTPIYVVGAAAALALGPDALNLAGTRMSSCRVASVFRDSLRARCLRDEGTSAQEAARTERARARRLENLAVAYVARSATVVVRGRPGDAAAGRRRTRVNK